MAYGAEHDRLRAVLPDGFKSPRPVLRINAEIRNSDTGYVEFNTAVEKDGVKGWLNVGFRDNVPFERNGKSIGKTLPAIPEEAMTDYPKSEFTLKNVAVIPCKQVLGAYLVKFSR